MRTKKAILVAQLPPTPCTPKMREDFIQAATSLGKSMAEAQRDAISLFLERFDSNAISGDSKAITRVIIGEGQ